MNPTTTTNTTIPTTTATTTTTTSTGCCDPNTIKPTCFNRCCGPSILLLGIIFFLIGIIIGKTSSEYCDEDDDSYNCNASFWKDSCQSWGCTDCIVIKNSSVYCENYPKSDYGVKIGLIIFGIFMIPLGILICYFGYPKLFIKCCNYYNINKNGYHVPSQQYNNNNNNNNNTQLETIQPISNGMIVPNNNMNFISIEGQQQQAPQQQSQQPLYYIPHQQQQQPPYQQQPLYQLPSQVQQPQSLYYEQQPLKLQQPQVALTTDIV
jgi:hypothetical protein